MAAVILGAGVLAYEQVQKSRAKKKASRFAHNEARYQDLQREQDQQNEQNDLLREQKQIKPTDEANPARRVNDQPMDSLPDEELERTTTAKSQEVKHDATDFTNSDSPVTPRKKRRGIHRLLSRRGRR